MNDSIASGPRNIEHGTFDEWPSPLRTLFDGTLIETKTGFTASLLAADEGRIRTSLLRVGELFAPQSAATSTETTGTSPSGAICLLETSTCKLTVESPTI